MPLSCRRLFWKSSKVGHCWQRKKVLKRCNNKPLFQEVIRQHYRIAQGNSMQDSEFQMSGHISGGELTALGSRGHVGLLPAQSQHTELSQCQTEQHRISNPINSICISSRTLPR